MPLVPIPAPLLSLTLSVYMASWEAPYNQLTEENKTWAWFTDGSVRYVDTTQKWIAAVP